MSDLAVGAHGLVADFHALGVLSWGDVHVAEKVAFLYDEPDERAILALALAVGALEAGSVCLDLAHVRDTAVAPSPETELAQPVPDDLWPDDAGWRAALEGSPMVTLGADAPTGRPLRLVGDLLYLERYWHDESVVASQLDTRRAHPLPPPDAEALQQALANTGGLQPDEAQTAAVAAALSSPVSVIAGGPGTGKTATIARILSCLPVLGNPRVALAAPTGKAAARMEEAIGAVFGDPGAMPKAQTIHRLLGWTPDSHNRFVHGLTNPLPDDMVIVDEASMVSLPLMARLLEALKPNARLVLVGDPDQLAPVEAGAVLADIVEARHDTVIRLNTNWRFRGALAELSAAVLRANADEAVRLATNSAPDLVFGADEAEAGLRDRVVEPALAMLAAARRGDADAALAALGRHRLLCAHRLGPYGVSWWTRQAEAWLAEADPEFSPGDPWYPGRPVLVTQNAPELGLSNGDTGVVVSTGQGVRVCFDRGGRRMTLSAFLLDQVQTAYAMTVHKAQGSQFDAVSLILPPPDSPLLTRELLYTAITRARSRVTIVGTEDALRSAVTHRARRASGLAARLS